MKHGSWLDVAAIHISGFTCNFFAKTAKIEAEELHSAVIIRAIAGFMQGTYIRDVHGRVKTFDCYV